MPPTVKISFCNRGALIIEIARYFCKMRLKDGRMGLVTVKDIVGIEGGLPIQFGGKHVGAIGISGAKSTEDEQCAKAALE